MHQHCAVVGAHGYHDELMIHQAGDYWFFKQNSESVDGK